MKTLRDFRPRPTSYAQTVYFCIFVVVSSCLGANAQTWPGAFNYKWDVIAQSGQNTTAGTIGTLGSWPSINEAGYVGFIGHIVNGTTPAGDAVFVSDGQGAPTQLNVGFVATNRRFGEAVQINNKPLSAAPMGDVLSWDQVAGSPQFYFERVWQGTAPGSFTIAAEGALSISGFPFAAVFAEAAFNDSEDVVFSGLDQNLNSFLGATNPSPPPNFFTLSLNTPLRPAIDNGGNIVVRAGSLSTSPILLYTPNLMTPTMIAGSGAYSALGMSPGISRDGEVIAFYGVDSSGNTGIWINVPDGTGGRQNIQIAGNSTKPELGYDQHGLPISFATNGFDPDTKVGVADIDLGPAGIDGNSIVVNFIGTPTEASLPNPVTGAPLFFTNQKGLWTVRIDVERQLQPPNNLVFHKRGAIPVIQLGDSFQGSAVTGIGVFDPVENAATDNAANIRTQRRGDHRVTFSITTGAGQAILRGTHLDSDQDGLLDHWETDGIDIDGDGVIDVDLKAMGADPMKRDLFLDVDWLAPTTEHRHDYINNPALFSVFSGAPALSGVVYGTRADLLPPADIPAGITLHVDAGPGLDGTSAPISSNMGVGPLLGGNLIPHADIVYFGPSCPSGSVFHGNACTNAVTGVTTAAFGAIKNTTFSTANKWAREVAFHYLILGDSYQFAYDASNNPFVATAQSATTSSITANSVLPLPTPPPGQAPYFAGIAKITSGAAAGQERAVTSLDGMVFTNNFGELPWSPSPAGSTFVLLAGSSGLSEMAEEPSPDFNSYPGNDFVVTLRGFGVNSRGAKSPYANILGTPCWQWRTIVHEMGHNLGLRHNGTQNDPKNNPAYMSLMSYAYQTVCTSPPSAVQTYSGATDPVFDDFGNLALDFSNVQWHLGNTLGFGSGGGTPGANDLDFDSQLDIVAYTNANGPIDLVPPVVTIQSPAPNSGVAGGGSLTVTFTASDNVAMDHAFAGFDLNGDGKVSDTEKVSAVQIGPSTYQAVFTGVSGPNGTRQLSAYGVDTSSNVGVDSIPITVGGTVFPLTVTRAGTGSGTVTSSPAGINCGTTCSANFASGTMVTLTETAAVGSSFAGWSGACTGTGTCSVTMNAAASVTATFNTSTTVKLNTWTSPSSGAAGVTDVSISGSGFPSGTILPSNVRLSVAPNCGGPGTAATALKVTVLLGSAERITFQLPASLTAGNYFISASGTTSLGKAFVTGNCSEVQVTTNTSTALGVLSGTMTMTADLASGALFGRIMGLQVIPAIGSGSPATSNTVNSGMGALTECGKSLSEIVENYADGHSPFHPAHSRNRAFIWREITTVRAPVCPGRSYRVT